MMRKFLLKVSIFATYAVFVSIIIPFLVDPFNVFHAERIRINGSESNKNYIKMKYILANPEKYDSFLFGSSRVGMIRTNKIQGENCYNMTSPSVVPAWHLLNIETLLKNNIRPRKIYIGVDSYSYPDDYTKQINDPIGCPYEYLADDTVHFMSLYFNPSLTFRALVNMCYNYIKGMEKPDVDIFYKYGWGLLIFSQFRNASEWKKASPSLLSKIDIDLALRDISIISDICGKNNIELILFTNPMHCITYLASVKDKDYLRFLEGLAEISDFWNFSSLNDITTNNANYYETSHYRSGVGDIMIDIMCSGKSYHELQAQGFGVKVTRENSKDFISMLRKQFEDYEKSHK